MKQFINKFYQEKITPFGTRVRFVKDLPLTSAVPLTKIIDRLDLRKAKKLLKKDRKIQNWDYYWNLGLSTVKDLETPQGILASGKNELFGAVFGRDSLITSLKLLKVYQQTKQKDLLPIVHKSLITLASLQGKAVNIESGEEPGKIIHEYRPDSHERVTKLSPDKPWLKKPWYVYPDGTLRNYDSVDSTPLFLIAVYRYIQESADQDFAFKILPQVASALSWLVSTTDRHHDKFLAFKLDPNRHFGGLPTQNWMDSEEAIFHEDGSVVVFPLATVEVQAYAYLAYRLWSKFFKNKDSELSEQLFSRSYQLKQNFNEKFLLSEGDSPYLAFAIDGCSKPLTSVRSNMGHVLWAALSIEEDGELEGILEQNLVDSIVKRLMEPDLFKKEAGIMTLSSLSVGYDLTYYHNGTIWPHDNSMIIEGLEKFGYYQEAQKVKTALLSAFTHFKTPVELFVYEEQYKDYVDREKVTASKTQAWSAAAILRLVANDYAESKKPLLSRVKLRKLTSKAFNWLFVYN